MPELRRSDTAGLLKPIQPRALIVTLYGLYAREVGGALSVSVLIRLMATVGVDESAVRSSISRLKRRGVLVARKVSGAAGYALSERGRAILVEGDRRIFDRHRADAGDGWLVAVFSVPESEREKRHRLRSRLSWLGFGTVASGVWIAPVHIEPAARDALAADGLADYVDLFRAEYVAFRPAPERVARWWDLDALERMYAEFAAEYRPVSARWRRKRRDDDEAAFADYVQVLTHWRRLPYLDPGLPADLLPGDWRGAQAADLFFALHERLGAPAHRYAETVIGSP
ncbi:PaaX family transcriptional regulator [Amycolatopsis sp. CA-230715]|uniref:PaaX family transcriptional regulator n=1 Tax=Amycolatopsis sp. CA-230715 TaxID=2745196 RepID=UPI001C334E34|nr:PaaX family transcriptional regulator C-terminal domain-containing protein [Amycolatopsis sp. CA-230715]QWF85942.1 Transcriptional repressor PaaX [Amycolatopsis sp. CA-230715]